MATMPKEAIGEHVVQQVALSLVVPSKNNPRKSFDDESLKELAESIKTHGVTSPILTRPVGQKFELIYGERRLRASKLAGKEAIPAIVRDMSDEEAEELRFVENIQREDLSAMEEAKELEKHYKGVATNVIAAKIGKPDSYVVLRFRLLKLIPDAQKALSDGKILLGHALELCKLREEEQKQALRWLVSAQVEVGSDRTGWQELKTHYSVEALRRFVQANFLLVLASAPFDTADPHLNLKMGTCGDCSYNTANLGTLFPNVKDARCTVPECFQIKSNKSLMNEIEAVAKETGKKVVRLGIGGEFQNRGVSKNMVDIYFQPYSGAVAEVEAGKECETSQPAVVTWIDPGSHTKATLGKRLTICVDPKCKVHHHGIEHKTATPLKGIAKVDHKAETLKANLGQRVRDEAFKQLAEKLLAQAKLNGKAVSFAALSHYVQAHLYIDRFRDAGKALGIEKPEKKSEFQGPDWEGAVVKHFAKNQSALILALVAAEGLQDADKKNALYSMAAEYRVDVKTIEKFIAREDAEQVKGMRERAKAREGFEPKKAKKAKAKKAPKKDRKKR